MEEDISYSGDVVSILFMVLPYNIIPSTYTMHTTTLDFLLKTKCEKSNNTWLNFLKPSSKVLYETVNSLLNFYILL